MDLHIRNLQAGDKRIDSLIEFVNNLFQDTPEQPVLQKADVRRIALVLTRITPAEERDLVIMDLKDDTTVAEMMQFADKYSEGCTLVRAEIVERHSA